MNTDGSNPSRLSDEEHATQCEWSPDGTKIVFTSIYDSVDSTEEVSDEEVYVINADGSDRTNLTTNSVIDLDPTWSPDGTRIAFISYMGGVPSPEIFTMAPDGSDVARVTTNPDGEDMGPAGNRFLGLHSQSVPARRFTHRTPEAHPCCWWRAPYSSPGVSCSMRGEKQDVAFNS